MITLTNDQMYWLLFGAWVFGNVSMAFVFWVVNFVFWVVRR